MIYESGGLSMISPSGRSCVPICAPTGQNPQVKTPETKQEGESPSPRILIVEGIDNVGKGTFIDTLIRRKGFYQVIKFEKPKPVDGMKPKAYQTASFKNGFGLIEKAPSCRLIFDRFHLGELVYSPLYRGYSGDYVFDLEKDLVKSLNGSLKPNVMLLLLTVDDFSLLEDDGKSFDPSKKEIEQSLFIDAFERSVLPKIRIQVNRDQTDTTEQTYLPGFKSPDEIVDEFLEGYQEFLG